MSETGDGIDMVPMQVGLLLVGLLAFGGVLYWAHRNYVTGWGGQYREIWERQGLLYMLFLARSGRAMLPGVWGVGGLFFVTIFGGLYREYDSEPLRVIALLFAVPSFALLIYALKQFVMPRRNAKVPDWVRELEEPLS